METRPEGIRVSIDVGCHSHRVAVGLSNGEVLDEFDLNHASQDFDEFFSRIDGHRRHGGVNGQKPLKRLLAILVDLLFVIPN